MNLLCISDKVLDSLYRPNAKHQHPNIDLLVGCGDLPFYYLDFLVSAFDVPMVYVRGNHDGGPQFHKERGELTGVRGGTDIHARTHRAGDLLFAGLEGSMRYKPTAPHMYTEREMWAQIAKLTPSLLLNRIRHGRALDILVTHSPPFGIHDAEDLPHRGFESFLWLMRVFRPKYLLHGHIHLYRQDIKRTTTYHKTNIINVYPNYSLNVTA